jgi:TolA-binding protein
LTPPAVALDEGDRLWLVGERAFADGLHPLARRVLERFVDRFPRDPRAADAFFLLGKSRVILNEPEAALEAFRRAQTYTPARPWRLEARFWEAEMLFRLKRFAEARVAYDDVVRTNAASPVAPDALYGLGFAELETQRPERAATAFGDFLKAWPEHAHAASATFYLARALVELKRYDEALRVLPPFVAKYPKHKLIADARYLLGWVRVTAGDQSAGVADLRAFIAAHPSHPQVPEAQRLITQVLARSADEGELREAYRGLMTQRPFTPEGFAEAAAIAERIGRPGDQEAAWRKLRAEFPAHPLAKRAALDLGHLAVRRKNWKEAASLAQAATASEDEAVRAEAWLLAGESELKLRRFAAASKAFDAVTTLPNVEPTLLYRALAGNGVAYEEQQQWRRAWTMYETVAERSPDASLREWARDRVAEMQARTYGTLMAQKPATLEGLVEAASIAERLSRANDQETAWRKLRAEFPSHPQAQRAAFDLAKRAFARKDWKDAAVLAQAAAASGDDAVRAEAWLIAGESELKLRRFPAALKAFDAVAAVGTVELGLLYRALAGAGMAHEEQQQWRRALSAYEAVADRSPDETLREWARERAAEMQTRLSKPPTPPKSPDKPAEKSIGKPTAKPGKRS